MSVYTQVQAADLRPFLHRYQAGELLGLEGIEAGVENTNYFVTTRQGEYVLTLFEYLTEAEAHHVLRYMAHLAKAGLPCPRPLTDSEGRFLSPLYGKPACLANRLPGQSVQQPTAGHCRLVGDHLARLHIAGQAIPQPLPNPRGAAWRQQIIGQIRPRLDGLQGEILEAELAAPEAEHPELPRGVIHADLFRDNVLFEGGSVSGLLDLYDAGEDLLLYDLAITVNDWCTTAEGRFDPPRLLTLLQAYHARRPVTPAEQAAWPALLRLAALRFWLSRIHKLHFPKSGELTQQKNPLTYQQLLLNYRQHPPTWPL